MQHRAAIKNFAFILTSVSRFSSLSLQDREKLLRGLVSLGDTAYALRQWDRLEDVGKALVSLPLPDSKKAIGYYFQGLAANPKAKGDNRKACSLFARVIDQAPLYFRAKALVSIGCQNIAAGNWQQGYNYNIQAASLATQSEDWLTVINAHSAIAILHSFEGDHRRALDKLESLWPMVRAIHRANPVAYLDYLNSLAIELSEVGHTDQARNAINIALSSSLAVLYPEWHETAREIEQIASAPVIVIVPDLQPETQSKPEKVLIILPVDTSSQASPKLLPIAFAIVSISVLICKSRPARAPPLF